MFKEFNVKFEDAEIIGGADNLLEGTGVTKVILRGDNKLSSLDSTFKNCSQLDTVDGELDLNGISDIDSLLENSNLVTSIDLKNVNNKDITANNSFSHVNQINIGGETYNKEAIQNILSSREWTFNNVNYVDTVGEDVVTHTPNISEEDENTQIVINDALEQKARNVEIKGQTYQNLIQGKEGAELLADIKFESIEGNPSELEPPIDHPVCVEVVEGQTYQNLIEGKGEYNLTDTYSATWTESNNSFENMPNVIEISEIYGNTVQDESDLSIIQSVGDLYVDEEGSPILDDEGNEQYKLEIESISKNLWDGKTYHKGRKKINEVWGSIDLQYTNNWNLKEPYGMQYDITGSSMRGPTIPISNLQGGKYLNLSFNVTLPMMKPNMTVHFYNEDKVYLGNINNGRSQSFSGNMSSNANHNSTNNFYLGGLIPDEAVHAEIVFMLSQSTNDVPLPQHIEITNIMITMDNNKITAYRECEPQQSNKTTILMPCKLGYIPTSLNIDNFDRLYWDYESEKYYIKQNIGKLNSVDIINKVWECNYHPNYIHNFIGGTSENPIMIDFQYKDNIFPSMDILGCYNTLTSFYTSSQKTKRQMYTRHGNNLLVRICTHDLDIEFTEDNIPSVRAVNESFKRWLTNNPFTLYYISNNPQTLETKTLEKPLSLETYSPITYISTNTEVQPSQMNLTNKRNVFLPLGLQANKDYTLQFNAKGVKNDFDLPVVGENISFLSNCITSLTNMTMDNISNNGSSITIDAINGSTDTYCFMNFNNQFTDMNKKNFTFKCDFNVLNIGTNSNKQLRFQCEQGDNTGYFYEITPTVGKSSITIDYNYTAKKYSITVTGSISYSCNNVAFSTSQYSGNAFRILTRGCKVEYSNVYLKIDYVDVVGGVGGQQSIAKSLTVNLGGSESFIQPTDDGFNHYSMAIKTPTTLTTDKLELSGEGVVVNDVMLFEGGEDVIKQEVDYVEGMKSIGEVIPLGSGVCGKNKFNSEIEVGSISTSGVNENKSYWNFRTIGYIECNGNTDYTVSSNFFQDYFYAYYDENKTFISYFNSRTTTTSPLNAKYLRLAFYHGTINELPENLWVQLEEGKTKTEYEPYINYDGHYKIDILSWNGFYNLYDINVGFSSNGFGYVYNGYIEVVGGQEYYSYDDSGVSTQTMVSCYDTNKNSIGAVVTPSKLPINCRYIKPDHGGMQPKRPMVVKGNQKQPYSINLYKGYTKSILLPQPLNKIGDVSDRLYWDEDKGHYCIEQNVITETFKCDNFFSMYYTYLSDRGVSVISFKNDRGIEYPNFLCDKLTVVPNNKLHGDYLNADAVGVTSDGFIRFVLWKYTNHDNFKQVLDSLNITIYYTSSTPNIIDLPHLNKKYSLDTYLHTTYLECSNSPMQPSKMYFETDKLKYKPLALETNKDYTIQFECSKNSDTNVKVVLGGVEEEIEAVVGTNHINITTPEELSSDRLYISGQGNKVSDVMLVDGDMKQYPEYFDGIESVGELQEDGKYKIDISTNNDTGDLSYKLSILLNEPLRRIGNIADRIYWDYDLEKYCIERNVGVVAYAGDETWTVQTLNSDYNDVASGFYTSIENAQRTTTDTSLVINDGGFICYSDAVYSYKPRAIGINRSGRLYLSLYNDEFGYDGVANSATKLSLFKEYLSSNPVTVYYSYTTPIIEEVECEGEVVNLPRLYQREETCFNVTTGNLRPSNIMLEYKNI